MKNRVEGKFEGMTKASLFMLIVLGGWTFAGCTAQQFGGRESVIPSYINPVAFVANPYLRAFAAAPVYWYPWEDEALQEARESGKLLAIDIGTTACYPCQVQEKVVYQDSGVIALMNEQFISIRIDRFERPDLARRYLSLLDGGGWPLQVIALPDGRPLAAGNYLTPERWSAELNRQAVFWKASPAQAERLAQDNWRQMRDQLTPPRYTSAVLPDFQVLAEGIYRNLDRQYGATAGTPKFPLVVPYLALLRANDLAPAAKWPQTVEQYLQQLADGAIYDQLGGGIMRCADDLQWRSPCFEKTLYDNAMLLRLLAAQYQVAPTARWLDMMYEIRSFLERELRLDDYQYASALRPDSEGELGRYYLWPEIEVRAALANEANAFIHTYNIRRNGNWGRGQNVLYRTLSNSELAAGYGLNLAEWEGKLDQWEKTMFDYRARRVRPAQDMLQITAWQSLLISAATECYHVTGDDTWLNMALRTGDHLRESLIRKDGSIYHAFLDGIPEGDGFLMDYAYTIEAFLQLYQLTLEQVWLDAASDMLRYLLAYHYQPEDGWFVSTPPAIRDWFRQYDLDDDVLPSGQAILARQILKISWIIDRSDYRDMARKILASMSPRVMNDPLTSSSWAMLAADFQQSPVIVTVFGTEGRQWHSGVVGRMPASVIFREQLTTRAVSSNPALVSIKVGFEPARDFPSLKEAEMFLRNLIGR
ncbi:MAG: DUF255 domain-containing protein [Bacteroidia bacterium]|nr:DUF255 domain-containing protein [Bacteroidia bacterium]